MTAASDESLVAELIAVVQRLNAAGDSWGPGEEIARIAIRRWKSYPRRHRNSRRTTNEQRMIDLVKGLQAHFEPDTPFTHPTDWKALARALAEVLDSHQG